MLHSYAGRCAVIELMLDHNEWRLRRAVGWWGDAVLRGAQLRRPLPGRRQEIITAQVRFKPSSASPAFGNVGFQPLLSVPESRR
jgi:hypothetical protein